MIVKKKNKMNCKQFNSVKLEEVLLSLGHLPSKHNEKEAWFLNPFGTETEASFKLDLRQNKWYLFSEGVGGNNIDLLRKYFNCSISEVLSWASEQNFSSFHQQADFKEPNYIINEISELQNWNLKKYLNERGLSKKIYPYLKEVKFTMNNKKLYAIGFENLSGGFELRNNFYKGGILKKDISIISNGSSKIFVFEGFIDGLSLIEMQENFNDDILLLNSVSLIQKAIIYLEKYDEIFLFLDNDKTGIQGKNELKKSFPNAKDFSEIYIEFKDYNEFLISEKAKNKVLNDKAR